MKIRISNISKVAIALCLAVVPLSCSVSIKFNGASIDYSQTKTIEIADFPIRSSYVWGPMGPIFNNQLKDVFANHTKLIQVKRNGDLKIEGEITRYDQRNKSVSSEGYSSQTELSMTVNVRFTNNANAGFRAPVHGAIDLRQHTVAQCCAGRTGDTDGEGNHRPDIQCYSG